MVILSLARQAIVEANMCGHTVPRETSVTRPMRLDFRFKPSAIICWLLLPYLAKAVLNP